MASCNEEIASLIDYFFYEFLEAIKIADKRIVVELAAMAADYIYMHYKVAEYDSRK